MQQTLPNRKIQPLSSQLSYILFRTAETMQNPRLFGFVLLSQGDDFVMAAHIVKDHGLLQSLREFDLPFKKFNLLLKTILVYFVQAFFGPTPFR